MTRQNLLQSAVARVGDLWRGRTPDPMAAGLESPEPERRAEGLFRRGRARMRAGDAAGALADFDEALALLPDYAEAIAARSETLDMMGRSAEARPGYERARQLWAADQPGAPDRRYLFRHPGRFTYEVESYELALRRIKTGAFPHLACGNALLARGRAADALKCYDRALKLRPKDTNLKALKGEALLSIGRHRQAVSAFNAALKANPKDVESLNSRGIANLARGKLDAANADWRRQFDLLPAEQAAARTCLAMRMADYRAVLAESQRALANEPGHPYWTLYGLTALCRLGSHLVGSEPRIGAAWPGPLIALQLGKAAPADVVKAADTRGRRVEAAFQLGVLAAADDRRAAIGHWKAVVEQAPPAMIEHAAARNELSRPA